MVVLRMFSNLEFKFRSSQMGQICTIPVQLNSTVAVHELILNLGNTLYTLQYLCNLVL